MRPHGAVTTRPAARPARPGVPGPPDRPSRPPRSSLPLEIPPIPLGTAARDRLLRGARRRSPSACACATPATSSGSKPPRWSRRSSCSTRPAPRCSICLRGRRPREAARPHPPPHPLDRVRSLADWPSPTASRRVFFRALHLPSPGPRPPWRPRVLLVFFFVEHAAGLRVPRARPSGARGAAARDGPLPARGPAPARPDRRRSRS